MHVGRNGEEALLGHLIPQENEEKQARGCFAINMTYTTIFTVLGTIALYKPSQNYAESSAFGKSISALIGQPSWPVFFIGAAVDWSGTNFLLTAESASALKDYINKQPTLFKKITKTGGVLLLAATQNMQPLAVSYATGTPLWLTITNTLVQYPSYVKMSIAFV